MREASVGQMLAVPAAEIVPFLVIRTTDWVKRVRDRARAGLALLLTDSPAAMVPAAIGMTLLVDARLRGGFARTQLAAALTAAPVSLREQLVASPHRDQRRLVFDVGLAHRWWRVEQLVALAESDKDIRIRAYAAEAVCREAVWTRRLPILQRLARSLRPEVRVVALTGLTRTGQVDQVAVHLDDASALVRAVARDAARRTGTDALLHHRQAVAQTTPVVGAIAGLAETGSSSDATAMAHLLAHPEAKVRARPYAGCASSAPYQSNPLGLRILTHQVGNGRQEQLQCLTPAVDDKRQVVDAGQTRPGAKQVPGSMHVDRGTLLMPGLAAPVLPLHYGSSDCPSLRCGVLPLTDDV